VSYDIYFVRRDPGQSFADALDVTEESYDGGEPGPLGSAELEQWERITTRAGQILDGIEEFATTNSRELADSGTGIQLSMIADEVSITVPSERPEQDAVSLMAKVYALARIVEDETGLEGYDPQLQEAITDPRRRISESAPHSGRPPFDEAWNDAVAVPASAGDQEDFTPVPEPASQRPWWKFWQS
jgi:hypothetical protein